MIIKNTEELIEIAKAHKEADRVKNGVYAVFSGKHNGERKEDWSLCAIGCLASPITLEEMAEEFPDWVSSETKMIGDEEYTFYDGDVPESVLIQTLGEKYGISEKLANAAEFFFEGYTNDNAGIKTYALSPEERQNWPLRFAKTLSILEGVEIYDQDIVDWFDERGHYLGYLACNKITDYGMHNEFIEWLENYNN